MALSKAEIRDWLIAEAPAWLFGGRLAQTDDPLHLKIANLLASALARVVEGVSSDTESALLDVYRLTASEEFVEDHGSDNGIERHPWESVEDFREICYLAPRGATPDWIQSELARLFPGGGYEVDYIEPNWQVALPGGTLADDEDAGLYAGQWFATEGNLPRVIFLRVPVPEVHYLEEGFFADEDAFADDELFIDGTALGERRRFTLMLEQVMEGARPHGCAWGFEVSDTVERAHHNHFFESHGAIS